MNKLIQIFKAGQRTDSNGVTRDFTEAQLKASAAAYDPIKHEAPIVVGHPTHDAPAYGWAKSLAYADGLEAEPHQVDPAFAEMFAAGRFKKISSSFYAPDSPSNPVPGVFYLRHIGFLGAMPPAVKGLRHPEFADAEEGVIEFADWGDVQNASLWRRLRDWMIGEKGLAVAGSIIPDYAVASLEQEAQKEVIDEPVAAIPQFSESQTQGDEMSADEKARLAALELENANLKKNAADFSEAQAVAARTARHAEHVAFAEGLVKEGKLLPAHKDVTVATLDFMEDPVGAYGNTPVLEFGEGDAKKPLADAFRGMLQAQPKQVEFAELAGGEGAADEGERDPAAVAKAAVEFQESEAAAGRSVNSAQAVQHVMAAGVKK